MCFLQRWHVVLSAVQRDTDHLVFTAGLQNPPPARQLQREPLHNHLRLRLNDHHRLLRPGLRDVAQYADEARDASAGQWSQPFCGPLLPLPTKSLLRSLPQRKSRTVPGSQSNAEHHCFQTGLWYGRPQKQRNQRRKISWARHRRVRQPSTGKGLGEGASLQLKWGHTRKSLWATDRFCPVMRQCARFCLFVLIRRSIVWICVMSRIRSSVRPAYRPPCMAKTLTLDITHIL